MLTLVPSTTLSGVQNVTVPSSGAPFSAPTFVPPAVIAAWNAVNFLLNVTAASAAGTDTLNIWVQASVDEGTTWDDFVAFTQVLGNGGPKQILAEWVRDSSSPTSPLHQAQSGLLAAGVNQGPGSGFWRVLMKTAGTGSFTFSLGATIVMRAKTKF